MQNFSSSAIKDNQGRGKVGDFLNQSLKDGSVKQTNMLIDNKIPAINAELRQ